MKVPTEPEEEEEPLLAPNGADVFDESLLSAKARKLARVYYMMYAKTDGWWWDVYGDDGQFSVWEYMSIMWSYEKNIYPKNNKFIESMSNNAVGWCADQGCDYSTAEGALTYMGAYSQTPVNRASEILAGSMTLNQAFHDQMDLSAGMGLVSAINNHGGGPFGKHDLYLWSNWSMYPKVYEKMRDVGMINEIWGGGNSVVILEHCQWQLLNFGLSGGRINQQSAISYCGGQ